MDGGGSSTCAGRDLPSYLFRQKYAEPPIASFTAASTLRCTSSADVPRHRLSNYGRQAFAVAGPTMLNSLPDDLRDPAVSTSTFRQSLKTHLFSAYQHV